MSEEIISLYLKQQTAFEGIGEEYLTKVNAMARRHILKKNSRIVVNNNQSSRVYFLVTGKMKIVSTGKDDNLVVKDIIYPGEIFGNTSLNGFHGEEMAEALLPNTVVYCFGVKEFSNLLKMNHQMALNYAGIISTKLNILKERYEIWTRYDAKTRLVYFLQKWAAAEGTDAGEYIYISNNLSLTDIADILSVSRQFLHALFKELNCSRLLRYSRTKIEIDKNLFEQFGSVILPLPAFSKKPG